MSTPHAQSRVRTLAPTVLVLFSITAFLGAALIFLVEFMLAKALLPRVGGSPAVWVTCMMVFQCLLLVGYTLAHALRPTRAATTKRSPRAATLRWLIVLILGVGVACCARSNLLVPISARDPALFVILTIGLGIAPVFVALSALSPALQAWLGAANQKNPYALSIASNLGSAAGMLGYLLIFERTLTQPQQWNVWRVLVLALLLLVAACAWAASRAVHRAAPPPYPAEETAPTQPVPAAPAPSLRNLLRERAWWLILALVPSSLMLGVTLHISTDIAAVPLLWVLPLLLYLASFVLAFAGRWAGSAHTWGRVLPIALVALLVITLLRARTPAGVIIAIHLGTLLVACTMCHRRLAELRPNALRLTEFYLLLALGGFLGGAFSALIAPRIFQQVVEYPLMLALVVFLRPQLREDWGTGVRTLGAFRRAWPGILAAACALLVILLAPSAASRAFWDGTTAHKALSVGLPAFLVILLLLGAGSVRFAACFAVAILAGSIQPVAGRVLARERTYFGVHEVSLTASGRFRQLSHGTTLHGMQAADPKSPLRTVPGTYYHRSGPVGDVIQALEEEHRFERAAFIGLGAGTMAAYAHAGTHITFIDIDSAVANFAQDERYFTFVADARARGAEIDVVVGDGRLEAAKLPDASCDLIVIDAFSSDAIPVHLMTLEAAKLYLKKVKPSGVVAFHVSNRAFNLPPVLVRIAHELGVRVSIRDDGLVTSAQREEGKTESTWVILARDWDAMGHVAKSTLWDRPWQLRDPPPGSLWTDDRSDVLSVFTGW